MKRETIPVLKPPKSMKGLRAVYRAAVIVVFALVVVLAAGSLFALMRPPNSEPLFYLGGQGARARGQSGGQASGFNDWAGGSHVNVFTGIGRLRVPLVGQPPATVVLSLSFPYPADDLPFAEELATRVSDFRSIAVEYFSSFSREELAMLDEATTRSEILARYNAMLRLGRIEELYFTDLIVLE